MVPTGRVSLNHEQLFGARAGPCAALSTIVCTDACLASCWPHSTGPSVPWRPFALVAGSRPTLPPSFPLSLSTVAVLVSWVCLCSVASVLARFFHERCLVSFKTQHGVVGGSQMHGLNQSDRRPGQRMGPVRVAPGALHLVTYLRFLPQLPK